MTIEWAIRLSIGTKEFQQSNFRIKMETQGKSYNLTLILSFFLGVLGADRFYLGHTGLGVLKLLTIGGFGLWALIDFVLLLMGKIQPANGVQFAYRGQK